MTYFATYVHHEDLNYRLDANYYSIDALEDEKKIKTSDYDYLENSLVRLASGGTPSGANYLDQGVLFIRTQNVQSNMIDTTAKKYISPDDNRKLKRSQLRNNDVLLTITGVDLGRSAVVPENLLPANINQHSVKLEIKNLDPYFLTVFLNSRYGQSQIWRRVYGATRPALNYEEIKELIIPTPKPEIQQYIGNKVRKAEGLREEEELLREKAKYVFEDYVGVLVANKRMIKNTEVRVLDNVTWAPVFYDSLQIVESNTLKFVTMNDAQESIKCGEPVKKEERLGETYPFYGASGISDTIGSYNFDGQYIIIAQDGSIGCVSVANGKFWANNHVWVVEANDRWDPYFLSYYLSKYPYWYCLTTGSVVPKVTSENLRKLIIPVVPIGIQKEIGNSLVKADLKLSYAERLIAEAKQDVEDLIEGNFDETKIPEGV